MMRTSPSQFEGIVDYMERNGDLNKPADGPSGRLSTINKWKHLTDALNLDATGTAKPVEKWKKVWSDLKNNTKRKAAKINQAASGTGGGPASSLTLTDLEQRVLSIIGSQAATGLVSVEEVGFETVPTQPLAVETGLPLEGARSPNHQNIQVEIEDWNSRPGGSSQSTHFQSEVVEATSPTRHHAVSPARAPRRVIRGCRRSHSTPSSVPPLPHRTSRMNQIDSFLRSDDNWRNMTREFVTEHLRLRETELQQQAQWQILFAKLINVLETIMNKHL